MKITFNTAPRSQRIAAGDIFDVVIFARRDEQCGKTQGRAADRVNVAKSASGRSAARRAVPTSVGRGRPRRGPKPIR